MLTDSVAAARLCFRLSTVLLIVFVAGFTAPSRADDLSQFVARLQEHYAATNAFSAKFTQTLTSAGGPPRQRTGQIYYQKPGRLRWEFGQPQVESIVSDGTTIYDYDASLNQVVETPLQDAFKSHSTAAFILGAGNLQRDFKIEQLSPSSGGIEHLAATPKDGGARLEFDVDRQTLNIVAFKITDALGNTDSVQLQDIRRNITLDPALFKFIPPPGADIIKAPPHV